MTLAEIKRNQYANTTVIQPHKDSNHFEDITYYHDRLAQTHNANLHDWGVAAGLEVRLARPTVLELGPGVAIDQAGQSIVLAPATKGPASEEGHARVGQQRERKAVPVQLDLTSSEVPPPPCYLTIEHYWDQPERTGPDLWVLEPWVQLQAAADYEKTYDSSPNPALVLAVIVKEGGQWAIKVAADAKAGFKYGRRVIGTGAGELRVRRAAVVKVNDLQTGKEVPTIVQADVATIGPGKDEGLQISVLGSAGPGSGACEVQGSLSVSGATTLNSLNVNSTLTVAAKGTTSLGGTLTVSGNVGIGTTSPHFSQSSRIRA